MSRKIHCSAERAQREILPLDLALLNAARDFNGGAAAIALTCNFKPSTLQHKLSPTSPDHVLNIKEFAAILRITKDRRILDSIHALVGDTIWQDLGEAFEGEAPEALTQGIAHFFRQVANLSGTWASHISDGVVSDSELAEIHKLVFRGIQALLGMYDRARQANQNALEVVHG